MCLACHNCARCLHFSGSHQQNWWWWWWWLRFNTTPQQCGHNNMTTITRTQAIMEIDAQQQPQQQQQPRALLSSASMLTSSPSSPLPSTSTTDDLTNLAWLQDSNLLNKLCFNKNRSNNKQGSGRKSMTTTARRAAAGHRHHQLDIDDDDDDDDDDDGGEDSDGGHKPPHSYSTLILMAIESTPHKAMMLSDIYKWLINNFPYFATAPPGWKNSIRHTLSLRKCFKKVIRSRTNFAQLVCKDDDSSNKAAYWYVEDKNKVARPRGVGVGGGGGDHSMMAMRKKVVEHRLLVCKPKYEIPKYLTSSMFGQLQHYHHRN